MLFAGCPTLFWLFSWLQELVQMSILPFFNSRGDENSKTPLTFLPTLQRKTWDKLDFKSIILMADFDSIKRGLPNLGSFISVISKSIFKILVPILLQISWIFQNTPNILNFVDTEGRYGKLNKNQHFCFKMFIPKKVSSLNQNFSSILNQFLSEKPFFASFLSTKKVDTPFNCQTCMKGIIYK